MPAASKPKILVIWGHDIGCAHPTSLLIDPTGKFVYVANAGAGNVSVYAIEPGSQSLTAVDGEPFTAGSNPLAMAISD